VTAGPSPLALPHHDGSPRYVGAAAPALGDRVPVRLWVPDGAGVDEVHVRTTPDGEAAWTAAVAAGRAAGGGWWAADVEVANPDTRYRFLVAGPGGQRWVTGDGTLGADPTDEHDFRLVTAPAPPSWLADAVVYEVVPDRFASTGVAARVGWPSWATPAAWDDPVVRGGRAAMVQLFGGDLPGIEADLDHVAALGADTLYLTPFFPAASNHRYDAASFDHVDPLLGGDEALASLAAALHRRGMRVVGDLTLNHVGATSAWFRRAQADPSSVEAGFFTFRRHPDDYECWFGVPSLPKLDHRSDELRRRLYEGPGSVADRFLRPPFSLDGWRIDVANMAGRMGAVDLNAEVARRTRATAAAANPDAWLVAEHGFDASGVLGGDGWHGTMAYAAFTLPVWQWLAEPGGAAGTFGGPLPVPRRPGAALARTADAFRAAVPWRSTAASMTLLGSHDTARWRSVAADDGAAMVGAGMLMAWPGVPAVLYGDEVGARGEDGEAARVPMPWGRPSWDGALLERWRALVAMRRSSPALRRGGFRWAHVGDDVLVWLREADDERVLCLAARSPSPAVRLPAALLGAEALSPLHDADEVAVSDGAFTLPGDGPTFSAWRLA
jgi:alpha-glucosidase